MGWKMRTCKLVLPEIQRMIQASQMTVEGRFVCMPPHIPSYAFVLFVK